MKYLTLAVACFAAATTQAAQAQTVWFNLHGAYAAYGEFEQSREFTGFGFGGSAGLRVSSVALELEGYSANVTPVNAGDDFTMRQGDVRATFFFTPLFGLQAGVGTRMISPEFAAQDVGFIRVGLVSENQISRLADLKIRGAYLAAPSFSGGGTAGFAMELGLVTSVGAPDGKFRVVFAYDFQRFDRTVNALSVPLQTTTARGGLQVGF